MSAVVSAVSAEVGSSSTMNSGLLAMARAIATRCCRPALRLRGSTACMRGSSPTNTNNSLIRACRAGPARPVWRSSNSPITCATVQRGLTLSSGSWNTICNLARNGRNCFSDRPASDVPWNSTSPELGCSRCSRQRPVVVLPDPLSPHQTQALARPDAEADGVGGVHLGGGPADGELLAQVAHLDQRCSGGQAGRCCGAPRLPLAKRQHTAGILGLRLVEELPDGRVLDDRAILHHQHAVGVVGDDAEVLRHQ